MNSSYLTQLIPVPQWPSIESLIGLFLWDAWSELFIYLITGIGVLVAITAWGYFKDLKDRTRFYFVLVAFALAMAGVVTFDNLILLFVAWELTSFLSYFLITFKGTSPEARLGGQQSLLVTALGGLCFLGAIILLGLTENAWTLSSAISVDLATNPSGPWIATLLILGAITKSAQFPFHFWLAKAMTAPTPASAYLHSATMVKAGVYLLYRLWPMLSTLDHVAWIVFAIGFITFAWGTFVSLLQLDLKGVLAGTTVAHLGLMVAMIAWPNHDLTEALFALVLSHAVYKAGLFLFSGVIERLSGTRQINLMNGLRSQSPFVFGVGLILAGANLGLPGTLAYHAKSLIQLPMSWKLAVTLGFLILGKAGLLVAVRPFLGTPKANTTKKNLDMMWFSPLVLGVFSWASIPLLGWKSDFAWKNLVLALGAAAIAIALLRRWKPSWPTHLSKMPWPNGSALFNQIWYAHLHFAKILRNIVQPKLLSLYILTVMSAFMVGILSLSSSTNSATLSMLFKDIPWNDVFVWLCLGKVIATLLIIRTSVPIQAVLFLGLVGYLFALVLAFAGAPDLAMTQFSVETLSVLVLLYAIKGVGSLRSHKFLLRGASIIVSVVVGTAVTLATASASLTTQASRLREYFSETSWLEAHGRNVVNVILVDFRALDTMGEITVLGIVTLGIYILLSPVIKRSNR